METGTSSITLAQRVMAIEAGSILKVADRLDQRFDQAVEALLGCRGRVVVTGVGKSGAIARKLAGILSSTGTPALFLHPAEGVHGDLGVVTPDDVVIVLSYSGASDEIVNILPVIKRIGAKCIALTKESDSVLARECDVLLDVTVDAEACPLGLAPTSSTTVTLALGDALALAVMDRRSFTRDDFAKFHPAGALGRRLILKVSDVMRTGQELAVCRTDETLRDVLFAITRANAGAASIVDSSGSFAGLITDGDVRRHLLDGQSLESLASEVMTSGARTILPEELAVEGLKILEDRKWGDLPVCDSEGKPVGMLMLKDLTKAGLV